MIPEADYEFDLFNTLDRRGVFVMHLKYWHVDDGFIFLAVASRVPTIKLSPLPGYAVIFLVFAPALSLSGSSPRSCKFIRRSKVSVNSQSVAQLSPTRRFHPHFFFFIWQNHSNKTKRLPGRKQVLGAWTCCTLAPRRRPPACIGCKSGIRKS